MLYRFHFLYIMLYSCKNANRSSNSSSTTGLTHTSTIGHYNPFRIIDLVSHTTYAVCVNFIHKWRDSERQIFWETFLGNFYLLSEILPEICWEEIRRNTFRILFWCLAWGSNPNKGSFNKPINLLDQQFSNSAAGYVGQPTVCWIPCYFFQFENVFL